MHFLKDFINLFLEREEGREKEREKHQCVVASHIHPTVDLACNLGLNQTSNPLVRRPTLNPLSHTSRGSMHFLLTFFPCLSSFPTTPHCFL